MTLPSFVASGDINVSRFVDISGRGTVSQSAVGSAPFGVSQQGTKTAPIPSASTLAAEATDSLHVYGLGEMCELTAGAAIVVGAKLKPDSTGRGVTIEGGEAWYAIALQSAAAAGEKIRVFVMQGTAPTPSASVAATGSTQANSTLLAANTLSTVSAADGTKGVVLPLAVAGMYAMVYNEHATNGLKIWPGVGDDVNDGTTDAAVTIEGKTLAVLRAIDATTWAAIYTVNS